MDLRLIKLALPLATSWPRTGQRVLLYPLTPHQIAEAEYIAESSKMPYDLNTAIIGLSTNLGKIEVGKLTSPDGLGYLFKQWEKHQEKCCPDHGKIERLITYYSHFNHAINHDAKTAMLADNIYYYYGKPTCELTSGQVDYFIACKSVYREHFIEGKELTSSWLRKIKKEIDQESE